MHEERVPLTLSFLDRSLFSMSSVFYFGVVFIRKCLPWKDSVRQAYFLLLFLPHEPQEIPAVSLRASFPTSGNIVSTSLRFGPFKPKAKIEQPENRKEGLSFDGFAGWPNIPSTVGRVDNECVRLEWFQNRGPSISQLIKTNLLGV